MSIIRSLAARLLAVSALGCAMIFTTVASAADDDGPRYMIGLRFAESDDGEVESRRSSGLLVQDVISDTPAYEAGIEAGDRVVRLGKKRLKDVSQLRTAVLESGGREMRLTILRDGEQQAISLQPVPLPEDVGPLETEFEFDDIFSGKGLGDLLRDFKPSDLLNLDNLDIEIHRGGGSSASSGDRSTPPWGSDQDAITIYGRINVGQLLGGIFPSSSSSDSERLERQIRKLQQEVERLNQRLERLSDAVSVDDR